MYIVKATKIGWVLGFISLLLLFGLTSAMTQGAAEYAGLSSYPPANSTPTAVVDMRTFKSDGTYRVVPGTTITYTIVITNAGTITVNDLFVQDFPFDGLGSDYVTVTDPEWKEMAPGVWWYPDSATGCSLSPSETKTITFTVELKSDAPYGSELINKAKLNQVPQDILPGNIYHTDTDIVVPGFNFSYLPLVTKAYAP